MKNATMKNPVKCDICSKLCKNKIALYEHKRATHPKVFPQCDMCGKYGKTKAHLREIIKIKSE